MDSSPNLGLPLIAGQQALKHVTHNEALRVLDAIAQLGVQSSSVALPPGAPEEGERYIVPGGGGGAWTGRDGMVAAFSFGAWAYHAPRRGWWTHVADIDRFVYWTGSEWTDAGAALASSLRFLGVNTTADAANRLSVTTPAALFNAESNDIRLTLNKAAAGDTASVLYQTGWSGRAEFGTTGNDDFHVKVSADGGAWTEALVIDRLTGLARVAGDPTLPLGIATRQFVLARQRELLTAHRTYFVRTDGNDGNTGLANNAGGAFRTIARALSVAAALDGSIYDVTVQVGPGTWTERIILPQTIGSGAWTLLGDFTTPANVTIAPSVNGAAITADGINSEWWVRGVRVQTSVGSSDGILAINGARLRYANIEFGACTRAHISARQRGAAVSYGNTSITGGALIHWNASGAGYLYDAGNTITLVGMPVFANAFVQADSAVLAVNNNSFSGGAAGKRYTVQMNAVCGVNGGGANYLPGDSVGTVASGGQYA